MKTKSLANSRFLIGFLSSSLLFGSAAFAIDVVKTPEGGYVLCVNKKTKVVTFPGVSKCPNVSSQLLVGAQGSTKLNFASSENEGPIPSTGELPVYNGTRYTTILSLKVPSAGSYWASFYTETWSNGNQTGEVPSVCVLQQNGNALPADSLNVNKHFMQRLLNNLAAGDVISLVCAQNTLEGGKAYNSAGYLLKVAD